MLDKTAYEIPRMVVAGRFSTDEEEERLRTAMWDPTTLFLRITVVVLLFTFSLQALSLAVQADWYVPTLVFPVVVACCWFLIAWTLRVRRRGIQARANHRMDRWCDEKCVRAGSMVSFYSAHVAYSTMRGSSVLPYGEITQCCETMDGIALRSQNGTIILRASDLTNRELRQIRELIQTVVRPAVYRIKAEAYGRLAEPLPHVRFVNFDTVISRASARSVTPRWKTRELLGFVIPQLLIYGLTPGLLLELTPWQGLDCLIGMVGLGAVGGIFTWFSCRLVWCSQTEKIRVAFTKDGLACQQNGFLTFAVNGRFRLEEQPTGVVVYFTSGESVFVPFEAVEQPQQLKEYLANRV